MRSNDLDSAPSGLVSTVGPSRRRIPRALATLALLAPFGCGGATSPNADAVLEGPAGRPSPIADDTHADTYDSNEEYSGTPRRSR